MISKDTARLLEILPDKFVAFIAKKLLNGTIKKYADIQVDGLENIKDVKKPIIFISNHLSNSDALILNSVLKKEDITFVAGVKLNEDAFTKLGMLITKTTPLKPNSADKEGLKKIISILKQGNNIAIFPEGTRSRTSKMIPGKKGILLIMKQTKANIIPIGISGTEKLMPINEKDMGKENFYHAKVHVNIGKSIILPNKNEDENKHEYEDRILQYTMKSIADLVPKEYRGVYK